MISLPDGEATRELQMARIWQNLPVFSAISISLLLSVTGFYFANAFEQQARESSFEQIADDRVRAVERRLEFTLQTLQSMRAFFTASERVDRQKFQSFVETNGVGSIVQALEWIPRVSSEDRARFEKTARREGSPDFQFNERDSDGRRVAATTRETYYPVYYTHPYAGNEAALGFDLGSSAQRLEALNRARDTGEMRATARITLVQGTSDQYGFLVFAPLYQKDKPHGTLAERRENLIGFGLGVFRIGDLIESAIPAKSNFSSHVSLRIFDASAPPDRQLIYPKTTDSGGELFVRPSRIHSEHLDVAGRRWLVEVVPLSDSEYNRFVWQPWIVLLAGFLMTGLLALYLRQNASRTARVRELVAARTSELSQTAAELARSNIELEQFAYIASHDLKSPLRGIDNLVKWIEEDLGDVLDDDTRRNIGLVRGRVRRLNGLLDDLLQYSKAGRAQEATTMVDVKSLIDEIIEVSPPPLGIQVIAQKGLPVFETNKGPLAQVLRNLIGNAVKHHDQTDGRVEVASKDLGDRYEFTVSDDGSGIDPKFREKVFQMFQTLRPRDEVEGSGMGLAIVRKLVDQQGGGVGLGPGLDSKGATFTFDWKKNSGRSVL